MNSLSLLVCLCVSLHLSQCVVVKTQNGLVRGSTLKFFSKDIHQFIGIRYAQPPIGELRFQKPKSINKWNGIYDATDNNPEILCWQSNNTKYRIELMNEDCLRINIWAPKFNKASGKLIPVMVWIHGGGYNSGSAYRYSYNGTVLATYDVVVVNFNYRLGNFGFLFAGDDKAPGNVGLHDQILALKWIQNNIASFGGDPKSVTIFGISSGGVSVGFHIISPLSKGLFKRAIMSSGSPYMYNSLTVDRSLSLQKSKDLSKEFNCTGNLYIECLQKLSPKQLVNAKIQVAVPIIGDEFYPVSAPTAMKTGRFNSEYELLAGLTSDEFDFTVTQLLTGDVNKNQVKQTLEFIFPGVLQDQIFDYYFSQLKDNDYDGIRKTLGRVYSDYSMNCPTYLLSKQFAQRSTRNIVYFYNITYKANSPYNSICGNEAGVCHAEDLVFLFGLPFIDVDKDFIEKDYKFSLLFMLLWSNFAKNGNPMIGSVPNHVKFLNSKLSNVTWPTLFSSSEQRNSNVTNVMTLDPDNFGQVLTGTLNSCDKIFDQYFK